MKKETLLHSSKIQKMIMQYKFDMQQVDHLMELAEPHYQIEPDLYMKYEVKRGLRDLDGRGVRAGLTTISKVSATQLVDGKEVSAPGQLLYRGIPIDQLVQGNPPIEGFPLTSWYRALLPTTALDLRKSFTCCSWGGFRSRRKCRNFISFWHIIRNCPTTLTAALL